MCIAAGPPQTKEATGNKAICASILDLPTSGYKINEEILYKAQHDAHTTLTKAEVEPFIIAHMSVKFNNKEWDIIGVSSRSENDFRSLVPLKLRVSIFHIFHDGIHRGPEKGFRLVESFYNWNSMRRDVIQ